jgi:hypothetical protein
MLNLAALDPRDLERFSSPRSYRVHSLTDGQDCRRQVANILVGSPLSASLAAVATSSGTFGGNQG